LASSLLHDPIKVEVTPQSTTVELIDQKLYYTDKGNKKYLLIKLLQDDKIETALVFTRTKYGADKLTRDLVKAGIRAEAIHGGKTQQSRQKALTNFKAKQTRILVATDIAARGIDIDNLTHVVNFELPNVPETYVHRIGRTGRAGALGQAISFCDYEEKVFLRDIQQTIRKDIDVVKGHPYDVVLMHPIAKSLTPTPQHSHRSVFGSRKRVFSGR
jgi:ATP-dependent RNA helicase RhlE